MLITVFTPTYNRAHLLQRLYNSLCIQSFSDFEWLIVDDGSKDETENLITTFIVENKLNIRYIKQSNGGKHRAINHGVKEAKGILFFIVDSDDMLPKESLEIVSREYAKIKNDKSFAGLAGFDSLQDGQQIGSKSDFVYLDCSPVDLWCKFKIQGDMAEIFRTDVLREIPFPEIEKETFCPEELEWIRISKKYKLRYVNKIIYIADYQQGGLSDTIIKIRMQSPISAVMDYFEYNGMNIPIAQKIKTAINYWRFRFCIKNNAVVPKLPSMWGWTIPLGFLMHCRDIIIVNKKK